jgi:translation initiation factor 2 beta subunit (eIF-2beta)/eIF-5
MPTIDLDAHRPHVMAWVVCLRCLHMHVAVWPVVDRPYLLECNACHEIACIPWSEMLFTKSSEGTGEGAR